VIRSPVTASRKLFVAAALLAGGYGAALVLSQATNLWAPPGASDHVLGWLNSLKEFASEHDDEPIAGRLVPEAPLKFASNPEPLPTTPRATDQPTWLSTTTEPPLATAPASHPADSTAPSITASEIRPIDPAADVRDADAMTPAAPIARITNVVAASADPASRSASPWDRWPRWDDTPSARGAIPATFQDTAAGPTPVDQATFSSSALARKNTPARDTGVEAPRSGRTHVVVDGDSLARLAERYLDDAALDDEIYRLNRDVLASPDLLPIGVELRIPDGRMADSTAGVPPTRDVAFEKPRAPSNMVPLQWNAKAFDAPPRAQLLRPIPAGRAN
jgi:nucleoid-associated protein YgaU